MDLNKKVISYNLKHKDRVFFIQKEDKKINIDKLIEIFYEEKIAKLKKFNLNYIVNDCSHYFEVVDIVNKLMKVEFCVLPDLLFDNYPENMVYFLKNKTFKTSNFGYMPWCPSMLFSKTKDYMESIIYNFSVELKKLSSRLEEVDFQDFYKLLYDDIDKKLYTKSKRFLVNLREKKLREFEKLYTNKKNKINDCFQFWGERLGSENSNKFFMLIYEILFLFYEIPSSFVKIY